MALPLKTEITRLPHRYTPRSYQLKFLQAWERGIRRLIIVWHRRSGKDKTVFAQLPAKMFERVGTYFYFLPTYTQAMKVIWTGADKDGMRFLDHIPPSIIKRRTEQPMLIELTNGSIVQVIGADNIDSIVGTNPLGVVFSEFALMKPKVWQFIRPILAENEGWAVFVYTPRGMNHAYELHQQAKENPLWFEQTLTAADTQAISAEALEEERRTMPQDLFEQEYYCKYIEGAGAFFKRIKENCIIEREKPEPGHRYQMGIDLAKYQDFTVITVIDLHTFEVLKQERFNQIDWNLQKAKIEAMYLRYGKPLTYLDSTGVGDPIHDDLIARGLSNIQSFKFTEQTRRDLLINLALKLETDKIRIPESETLIGELQSFHYELTDTGKTKLVVPEGLHDDCVFSLALACWQIPENPLPKPGSLRFLNNQSGGSAQTSYE